ncbi:phosphatase PAP2 family protein [Phenylobacterium sp.]|uniref:acid phosphatase n=1 Tax=Phenylobacterium sp. TaxID=1871053 RepID=UPI002DE4C318|nr:phosphatase PAP2 family protein [Phenylobacterium sp.]
MIRYGVLGAAAALTVAAIASAQGAKLAGYMHKGELDGTLILGPPPAADSPRARSDRQTYLDTRTLAGSKRWTLAERDNDLWQGGAVHRFSCALGAEIGPKTTPVAYRVLQRVELDVRTVGTPPKDHYNRTRPPIGDAQPLCVPREDWMRTNASYPSGHSMAGWAWGLILSELRPDRASELMVAGREIGQSRVVCGVHFQSDVDAGRELGAAMVAKLHDHPEFRQDLETARAELVRDRTPPTDCDY